MSITRSSIAMLFIAALGCGLNSANAQSSDQGYYFSPEVAYALPVDGQVDDTVFIGARFGYGMGDGLSVELESGWAEYAFDPTENVTNVDVTTIPVLANLRYSMPAQGENLGWYGYAGLGWGFNEIEDNSLDTDVDDSFIWQIGGGAEYPIAKDMQLFLDIRYLWNRADLAAPEFVVERTEDDVVLSSVMFTTGVRF